MFSVLRRRQERVRLIQKGTDFPMDDEPTGLIPALRAHSGVLLGIIGLAAWIALLWFMFGDVL
ncbi:hypothetical protein SAMN02927924_03842 [Sphingobium faniae]|nr:hypothetical protein SAMN02927924_03842 [Sphingobium faniae]